MKFYSRQLRLQLVIWGVLLYWCNFCCCSLQNRSFSIDYEHNTFLKDGQKFRYISGSIHYFRLVEEYWDRTLKTIQLGGFNAITTYIEWNSHQPDPSENFNFDGNLNIFKFLDTALDNNLMVILRPGPYIDAERDMGGLPSWLLWQKNDMKLRTSDPDFLYFVTRWFDHLLPRLKPYLYENGGPVIMIQIENEYGAYGCDKNYMSFLRDLIRSHLRNDTILFTTDNSDLKLVKCGFVPTVYPTVDFGPELPLFVYVDFGVQRYYAAKGPLVNSEFYPGWFDHWQTSHSTRSIKKVVATMDTILSLGANVNLYMTYGGTSFGFGAGANIGSDYAPCTTSYDYDALISEAGDPTVKYFAIKNLISKYHTVPSENPVVAPKGAYGKILLKPFSHVMHPEFLTIFGQKPIFSQYPLSFEQLKVGSGFVTYQTNITFIPTDPALLSIPDLRDRAYIYVDGVFATILSRAERIFTTSLLIRKGSNLSILVENQGRSCTGHEIGESKGMGLNVTLNSKVLTNWTMLRLGKLDGRKLSKYSYSSSTIRDTNDIYEKEDLLDTRDEFSKALLMNRGGGSLLVGNFTVEAEHGILDTFISFDGFSKGFVWINGFNLGRYWPVVGPQLTLYLPAPLLKTAPEKNTVIILELEQTPEPCYFPSLDSSCFITLTDVHILDGPTP